MPDSAGVLLLIWWLGTTGLVGSIPGALIGTIVGIWRRGRKTKLTGGVEGALWGAVIGFVTGAMGGYVLGLFLST